MGKKVLKWTAIILIALLAPLLGLFLLIQRVPYGHNHTNPPVRSEPNWDSPATHSLVQTACFDCHSNETSWGRWYEGVAPFSWLVVHDVEEGRQHLNFSEWNEGGRPRELNEIWRVLQNGSMPPLQYLVVHPEAKLTADQIDQLIAGLQATVNQ